MLERLTKVAFKIYRWIEIIQCLGHKQIGIGIKIFRESLSLVVQIALNLKIDIETETQFAGAQISTEISTFDFKIRDSLPNFARIALSDR